MTVALSSNNARRPQGDGYRISCDDHRPPLQTKDGLAEGLQSGRARSSYSHMSGISFDTPAPRFLRSSFFERAMLVIASLMDHWLTCAGCLSKLYRRNEAEFPAAQTANKLQILRGLPAADGVSFDALRPNKNWVNLKDQYEISFIRETSAAFARRLLPTKGRWSLALSAGDPQSASKKIVLAKNHSAFHQRKNEGFRRRTEWCAAGAIAASA